MPLARDRFRSAFRSWSRGIRLRLGASHALTGAAIAAVIGAAAAGVAWKMRASWARPWMATLPVAGALAGAVFGLRKRWKDQDVALYLDGRLGSHETITTALEQEAPFGEGSDAAAVVLTRAAETLEKGDRKRARPEALRLHHLALPAGLGAIVLVARLPIPAPTVAAPTVAPPPPGTDSVTLAHVQGLEKVIELGALSARDDEQKKRLETIAKDAQALREKLAQGMERREAENEIARLRDEVQAERLSLGDGPSRQGLEAALKRLAQEPLTKDAAKALGDRDLVRFDEEMQKLANNREKSDRERAKKALEEAAKEARKNGASDVAKALEGERDLLDKRGNRADELRELAKELEGALTDEQKQDLEEFGGGNADDKSAKKLARSMEDALKKLSPEERKKLAEKMKRRLAKGGPMGGGRSSEKDWSKMTEKELEEELRTLANEPDEDDEAERQKKLDGAEKGLGDAQKGLGAPMPLPAGGNDSSSPPSGASSGDPSSGTPGGHHEDKGTGKHDGQSKDVKGDELRARAGTKVDGKAPAAGVTMGRTAGREGDTANVRGTGALGKVGPSEVSGVDRSEVPEEYREQVGRYFTP